MSLEGALAREGPCQDLRPGGGKPPREVSGAHPPGPLQGRDPSRKAFPWLEETLPDSPATCRRSYLTPPRYNGGSGGGFNGVTKGLIPGNTGLYKEDFPDFRTSV